MDHNTFFLSLPAITLFLKNFIILIGVIALLQFSGYIAIRFLGEKTGLLLTGFLGGFVSSTVVFANLSHTLQAHSNNRAIVTASAILANLAMLIEMSIIVFIASPTFLFYVIKPLLIMGAASLIIVLIMMMLNHEKNHHLLSERPINPGLIIKSALLITVSLVLIALTKKFAGSETTLFISFLTGLFEIHGVSLATGLLYANGQFTLHLAAMSLFCALAGSFASKLFLLWSLTERSFALKTSAYLLIILISGAISYWMFLF